MCVCTIKLLWQPYLLLSAPHSASLYSHEPQVCLYKYKVWNVTFCRRLRQKRFVVLLSCAQYSSCVLPERTIWNIMHEWPASARSHTVNSEFDHTTTIYIGMQNECLFVLCHMLWCANECLHVLCNRLWYAKCMFVCTMLVCCIDVNLLKQLPWHYNLLELPKL